MPDPAARRTRAATVAMGARSASLLALLLTSALALLAGCGARAPQAPGPSKPVRFRRIRRDDRRQPQGRRVAAARRPAGLRGRQARLRRHRRPAGDQGPGGPQRVGHERVRLHRRRCAADREPEPVAAGQAERPSRPVQGGRRHLPGARLRPLEHDGHRRPHGLDRRRSADDHRDGGGGAWHWSRKHLGDKPVVGGDLHAQPRRPLRRRRRPCCPKTRSQPPRSRSSRRRVSWKRRPARTCWPASRWAGARSTCTAARCRATRRATSTPASARRRRRARSASDRRPCSSTTRRRTWTSTACDSCSSTRRTPRRRRS